MSMYSQAFCRFGGASHEIELDNVKFAKLARDCNLINRKCSKTDIDLIFTQVKPKGLRKINYAAFQDALRKIGAKLHADLDPNVAYDTVARAVINSGGPGASGTVNAL